MNPYQGATGTVRVCPVSIRAEVRPFMYTIPAKLTTFSYSSSSTGTLSTRWRATVYLSNAKQQMNHFRTSYGVALFGQ